MTFSPFYMGNDTEPQTEDGYVISENWGFQINFMVPLNRDLTKQCERMAESQIQKNKLDFELVRALKCAELQQKGFTLLPGSRVYHICSDVVPIQSLLKTMLAILKPFVLSALKSPKFKTFVVELLEKLVEQSDNDLDDKALAVVKKGLGL